jgi:hypothetical protein
MSTSIGNQIIETAIDFCASARKMGEFKKMIKEIKDSNINLNSEQPSPELISILKRNEGAIEAEEQMQSVTQKLFELVDEYNSIKGQVPNANE